MQMKSGTSKTLYVVIAAVLCFAVVTAFAAGGRGAKAAKAIVASGGATKYVIVLPDAANIVEKHAAAELQTYIQQISGARLEIVAEKSAVKKRAILIGSTKRGAAIIPNKELKPLGPEGFILRERGGDVAIRGGGDRGTMYGVYSLLEDHLGVRWYTPEATVVPKRDTIDLTGLKDKQKPAYEYREPFFYHAFNADWAARNRANGNSYPLDDERAGKISYVGFVHTAFSLLPPGEFFKDHPEYFSEINGKRVPDAQLCLTNPDVLRIVTERVMKLAEATKGKPTIISVSQNDNVRPCKCKKCLAIDKEEGGPTGTLIRFVNNVADAVAKKYPNVAIDTLAYQYTENAPRLAKPRPNVIVRLCHMAPSCDTHPLGKCYMNANYVKNLKKWSKISNRLYTWHYVTDFAHYLMPLPDLNAIVKDVAFYRDNHVKGFFAQGSYQSNGGDMAELKAWVLAKLMWNPDADAEALIDDFVKGYYGPAAPAMAIYINVQRERALNKSIHEHLYSPPQAGLLTYELLNEMTAALDLADALAANQPVYLDRIGRARLAVDFTHLAAPELFVPPGKNPNSGYKNLMPLFDKFKVDLKHYDVTVLRESETLDQSLQHLRLRIVGWKD